VTLACRSAGKAEAAAADIVVASGCDAAQIQCMQVDLASLASVRQFSAAWNAKGQPVSALFNNAGVMAVYPQQFTDDGFEVPSHSYLVPN
jgi:retinol dehydrogenase-12